MEQEIFKYIDGYQSSCKYYSDGNVNIILSAPHGGILMPGNVPDRTDTANSLSLTTNEMYYNNQCGKLAVLRDNSTDEFTENVAYELNRLLNLKPFIIIGKWHRKKVDFNREIFEATLNHPEAISAYENYHMYLDHTIDQVHHLFGKGLLFDIHGHAQGNYSMMGYMLSREQLNQNDLSDPSFITSIESLCSSNRNEVIRGKTSFGSIFERHDLGVTYPSFMNPKPESRNYFSGGYIVKHYSSKINAIQMELSRDIRIGKNKHRNARNVAYAIVEYMKINNLLIIK